VPYFSHDWISWRLLTRNWCVFPSGIKYFSSFGLKEEFALRPLETEKGAG
jgi:hypothetical protein